MIQNKNIKLVSLRLLLAIVFLSAGYMTFKGEKAYASEFSHYAGNSNTTVSDSTNFRAYFTADSNASSVQYAFWYVPTNVNCSNGENQFQIRKVSDDSLVTLWGNSPCHDVASGTIRTTTPNFNNMIAGTSYYATFGFNSSRTVIGNGALDFNFVLNSTSTVPIPPTPPKSEIYSLTYSTSTNMATVTGYWSATTTPGITEEIDFYQTSTQLGVESFKRITATSTGSFSLTFPWRGLAFGSSTGTTTAPIVFTPILHAELYQRTASKCQFGGDNSACRILLDSEEVSLGNEAYFSNPLSDWRNIADYPQFECSISSITGCLKNAGVWLFYPSSDSVENFKMLSDQARDKFPFAYVYQVNDMRLEMFNANANGSTTLSVTVPNFGTITFLSKSMIDAVPYSGLIKNILGWLLWFFVIEYAYFRALRMHDNITPK